MFLRAEENPNTCARVRSSSPVDTLQPPLSLCPLDHTAVNGALLSASDKCLMINQGSEQEGTRKKNLDLSFLILVINVITTEKEKTNICTPQESARHLCISRGSGTTLTGVGGSTRTTRRAVQRALVSCLQVRAEMKGHDTGEEEPHNEDEEETTQRNYD